MTIDSSYDLRQLAQMKANLDAFDEGQIGLNNLVSNLEALIDAIESVDPQWKNALLKQWGVLEDVRAHILFKGFDKMPKEHAALVKSATHDIRTLLTEKLEK